MSGLEVLAIAAGVFAMVSAFNDGADLLQKLRKRRRLRKTLMKDVNNDLETVELEDSLVTGPTSIRRRYDWGYNTFGDRFARGDSIAEIRLKDIIIHLQGQVIVNLKSAWDEDSSLNYRSLQHTSDRSRDDTIECLIALHQRLLSAAPILELAAREPSGRMVNGTYQSSRNPQLILTPASQFTNPQAHFRRNGQREESQSIPYAVEPASSATALLRSTQEESSTTRFKRKLRASMRRTTPGNIRDHKEIVRTQDTSVTNHYPDQSYAALAVPTRNDENFTSDAESFKSCETNSIVDEESRVDVQELEDSAFTPPERERIASATTPSTSGSSRTSDAVQHYQMDTVSDSLSKTFISDETNRLANSNRLSVLPGEHNNFRGLCKSAVRLQNNNFSKAVKVFRPKSGHNKQLYWCCTKCNFECRPHKDPDGRDALDSATYTVKYKESGVVHFRWAFLFRSHVTTTNAKKPKFACVFCSNRETGPVQGPLPPLRVFDGIDQLVVHVVREHVGDGHWPTGEVLYRMNCAVEGGSGVEQGWDIYLGSG